METVNVSAGRNEQEPVCIPGRRSWGHFKVFSSKPRVSPKPGPHSFHSLPKISQHAVPGGLSQTLRATWPRAVSSLDTPGFLPTRWNHSSQPESALISSPLALRLGAVVTENGFHFCADSQLMVFRGEGGRREKGREEVEREGVGRRPGRPVWGRGRGRQQGGTEGRRGRGPQRP